MAKKSKKKSAVPTRKQIALSKRDRQLQRWVYIALGVLVALVLGTVGYGAYQEYVRKPATPIATVNGEPISLSTYQKRVRYHRWDLDRVTAGIQAQMAQIDTTNAENEYLVNYYQQMLEQIASQRAQIGQLVVDELIRESLVRQKAAAEKIAVSDEEVSQEINRQLAQSSEALTAVDATATIAAGPEATATALTFTPTPLPTPTPTLTATLAITAPTLISPTATPAPTPTPRILSEQDLSQQRQQFFQRINQGAGWNEADYRELIRTNLLFDKLQKFFEDATTSVTAEQVHASHILSKDEEAAKQVLARVQKGEDFAALAKELSTDEATKDKGGDLGWFPADTYRIPTAVVEAAFALQPGQVVTAAVQSYEGYHVVKVLERDPNRLLDEKDLQARKQQAFSKWLQEQMANPSVVVDMWSPEMVPTEESRQQPGA
jgi:parvulin-like peptidyl-prolyl isomerase